MIKIALTGNLASGKSTVGKIFQEAGFYVFDADSIIRQFYEEKGEVYKKVVEAFGKEILDEAGNIDRKKLADVVFENKEKLRILEDISLEALYR